MDHKISVVIRNKNQEENLEFLLSNLQSRYAQDIDEIIIVDNESTDGSQSIGKKYGVRWVTISEFGYGKSANLAASSAKNDIVVIFSAHAFPVSHDFFKIVIERFKANPNLAGVRGVHYSGDFKVMIQGIKPSESPNRAGLMFCGSAFSRKVWAEHPFQDDIVTFEDKEWTLRVLNKGFDIEVAPMIFCYDLKRSKASAFRRFKTETFGNRDLWGTRISLGSVFLKTGRSLLGTLKYFLIEIFYVLRTGVFLVGYVLFNQSKTK